MSSTIKIQSMPNEPRSCVAVSCIVFYWGESLETTDERRYDLTNSRPIALWEDELAKIEDKIRQCSDLIEAVSIDRLEEMALPAIWVTFKQVAPESESDRIRDTIQEVLGLLVGAPVVFEELPDES